MKCERLIVIGDGIIYRCGDKFYMGGSAQLDLYTCFEGIDKVYLWSRIFNISEKEAEKYDELKFGETGKEFHVEGIYDQKPGYFSYVLTFFERLKKMKQLFQNPALIMCQPISVSQWMYWYFFRKKYHILIGRCIGDPDGLDDTKKLFHHQIALMMKHVSKKYYSKCALQTWVSEELENKYRIHGIPSVIFHDFLMYQKQMKSVPKISLDGKLRLLFVGRLSEEKGILDLIRAVHRLENKNILLQIAGQGDEQEKIEDEINKNHMTETVHLMGYVSWGKNLFVCMSEADCLVLPSYNEGLGMVLLEAMANGTTVIASEVGGIPDVVKHGENGLLFEAGNVGELSERIDCLYKDRQLLERMSRKAIETANENSRDKQLQKFKNAYMEHIYRKLQDN